MRNGINDLYEIPEANTRIWRSMDFTKFANLLMTRALFFSRSDLFTDQFEGSYPVVNIEQRVENMSEDARAFMPIFFKKLKDFTYINCWHMNHYESYAMWNLYVQSGAGIAIQSTVGRLKSSVIEEKGRQPIIIGKVRYIDFAAESIPKGNYLAPYIYKQKVFEYEQELRCLLHINPTVNGTGDYSSPTPAGVSVEVDLQKLIEKIYIAPTCAAWEHDTIQETMYRYKIKNKLTQSVLKTTPVF